MYLINPEIEINNIVASLYKHASRNRFYIYKTNIFIRPQITFLFNIVKKELIMRTKCFQHGRHQAVCTSFSTKSLNIIDFFINKISQYLIRFLLHIFQTENFCRFRNLSFGNGRLGSGSVNGYCGW